MKVRSSKLFLVLVLTAVICLPGMAMASTILNFDDIGTAPSGYATMPSTYGGLTWTGTPFDMTVLTEAFLHNTGSSFPSGLNAVRSAASMVTSADPFFFDGASFGTMKQYNYNQAYSATSVTITGYLGANLVGSQTINFTPTANGAAYALTYTSGTLAGAVDKLVFTDTWPDTMHYGAGYFLMDNFAYTLAPTPAVPVPPSVLLLGSGLLGLGALRFRRGTCC